MEAAACGVPVFPMPVGSMPGLIQGEANAQNGPRCPGAAEVNLAAGPGRDEPRAGCV